MSSSSHKAAAPKTVGVFVITVSDTRTPDTDGSGDLLVRGFESAGHRVVGRAIVRDEPVEVREKLLAVLGDAAVQAVVLNGGTGMSRRDGTFEVVTAILDKTLDGFGEIFRMLSYQDIGSAAMLSRAVAGAARGRVVVSIPGSPAACRLALERLILPELGHMVFEINR